jgi:hypothetical protein
MVAVVVVVFTLALTGLEVLEEEETLVLMQQRIPAVAVAVASIPMVQARVEVE